MEIKEAYFGDYYKVDRISASDIKLISESILHWLWYKNQKATKEMEFGTAFHTAILEPQKFAETYMVGEINKRTKEGKAITEKYKNEGKIFISEEEFEILKAMQDSYYQTNYNFHKGIIETPIYFDYYGVPCKSKPDVFNDKTGVCIDFKTTNDCSSNNINYSIRKYKYYIQAEFYKIATGAKKFLFIFCEKKPPYAVRIIELTDEYLQFGREEINNSLDKYKLFMETSDAGIAYPSYELIAI